MVNFLNTFMSYGLLLLAIAAVAGIAIVVGITLAKAKNNKTAAKDNNNEE